MGKQNNLWLVFRKSRAIPYIYFINMNALNRKPHGAVRLVLSLVLLSPIAVWAQEMFSWSKEQGYCNPSVIGLPRAKALILKYEVQPTYIISSKAEQGSYGDDRATIKRNSRIDVRLRFPIVNKSSLTIAGGLKYSHEEFLFRNPTGTHYPFYGELEDRSLNSIGLHLYVVKPTHTNKYFILRASFDLNGDYDSEKFTKSQFLKFSVTPLIGWKKSDNLSYAVGFSYGYTFGVPLIYPVISYNRNFNCNWGIESILPVSLKLRYTKNEKNYWYAGFELAGTAYRLDNAGPEFSNYNNLHLFSSELRFAVTYEREIHDWLWFGLEAGARHNFGFNLTNGPKRRSDIIIRNRPGNALLMNVSIFVVPPRGLLSKN